MENKVELIGVYGDDLSPAAAAWYSTSNTLTDDKLKRVPAVLKTLAGNDDEPPHSVVFEHTLIQFRVISDVATHIHFLKHRVGVSISSQSARWKENNKDEWYTPDDWPKSVKDSYDTMVRAALIAYHAYIRRLEEAGMSRQRAKESARFILPYGTQMTYLVTFNFLSFIHFQNLRNSDKAQQEVRKLAADMLRLVRETHRFDRSLEAWGW